MQCKQQVKELRLRSLTVLKDWHEAVEGINACVEDWDQRLRGVEILVRGRDKVLGEEESYWYEQGGMMIEIGFKWGKIWGVLYDNSC
jgi:hypothetical protein